MFDVLLLYPPVTDRSPVRNKQARRLYPYINSLLLSISREKINANFSKTVVTLIIRTNRPFYRWMTCGQFEVIEEKSKKPAQIPQNLLYYKQTLLLNRGVMPTLEIRIETSNLIADR